MNFQRYGIPGLSAMAHDAHGCSRYCPFEPQLQQRWVTMTEALFRDLARRLSGDLRSDGGTRAAYASDASNHRIVPSCVVFPRDALDIATTVRLCADNGV